MITNRNLVLSFALAALAGGANEATAAEALSGASKLMGVATSKYPGKVHMLAATLETTQWGWFDNAELPRLTVNSGDTVIFETNSHSHGQLWPGKTIEEIKKLRTDWPGRGPMTLTGPVFVNGAEPGDVLKLKINKIVSRPRGATTPCLPAPSQATSTTATWSRAPRSTSRCSCPARSCGRATRTPRRAMAR
jgi:hypothetical protein